MTKTRDRSYRQILDQYCARSGQMVRDAMCSIFLSPNVNVQLEDEICSELNIMTEALSDNTSAS